MPICQYWHELLEKARDMAEKYGPPGHGVGARLPTDRLHDRRIGVPAEGWDSYRRWIKQVTTQGRCHIPMDSSLYTWNGYKDWMKRVKMNWDDES